jgi:hypothetical protein
VALCRIAAQFQDTPLTGRKQRERITEAQKMESTSGAPSTKTLSQPENNL